VQAFFRTGGLQDYSNFKDVNNALSAESSGLLGIESSRLITVFKEF
jgi:hypothetical protein